MQIALECPTSMLETVQPLADFSFLLSHLVLEDTGYAAYYRDLDRVTILDNSVNELLEPVSLDKMEAAAELVRPDFVIAPDFLGDAESTVGILAGTVQRFGYETVIPVVQGSTMEEVQECAQFIKEMGFDRIAVPYDILEGREVSRQVMAQTRRVVVREVLGSDFNIHLLGLTTLRELQDYSSSGISIKSIDTGVPILAGLLGSTMDLDFTTGSGIPTMNQMSNESGPASWQVFYNIAMLRKYSSDGS